MSDLGSRALGPRQLGDAAAEPLTVNGSPLSSWIRAESRRLPLFLLLAAASVSRDAFPHPPIGGESSEQGSAVPAAVRRTAEDAR